MSLRVADHTDIVERMVMPASTERGLATIREIERVVLEAPQIEIATHHVLHAGVYSRTICIPADVVLTGALIKVPTTLTVCGFATVLVGDGEEVLVSGYHVMPSAAGRKVGYIAHADTWVTMAFKTDAQTIEAAENEFTDEADRLFSRCWPNVVVITGD
ncbi:hypothetical protein [Propionivibrio dicarboxylicus]|uniref:Uncharacterized protein n=1 Tax=Propionivibrio dicarboxylicus TaxID=83767 RepID=A0A1G8AQR8_9RHOO|nr:hypothetical protein [Propionivibrio dicarboxylicus]SDH23315.1 hypothetical protein SAMN05660652_01467 [Propionivibrio dicarboxylicus]